MTTPENKRIFVDELARRWRMTPEEIVGMAVSGRVPLWISFAGVYLQKTVPSSVTKKRKPAASELHSSIEVQPAKEILAQIQNRFDRMLIAAELPCKDAKGVAVMITNSVGEEWGEISMIGLKPSKLFARLDDVTLYERKNKVKPNVVHNQHSDSQNPKNDASLSRNTPDHPCFAPELLAAIRCWNALCSEGQTESPPARKSDILAWLQRHHPELSQAAMERVARVATPSGTGRCRTNRSTECP